MKYILDFDRTLFDVDALLKDLEQEQVDFSNLGPEVLSGHPSEQYLYADVIDFLQSKKREDLYILTALSTHYGERILQYQKAKVEQEPLLSLVHEIRYVEKDKGVAAREIAATFPTGESIVFVDDLLVNSLAVKAALPEAECFLLDRQQGSVDNILLEQGIIIVHSLAEVATKTPG